MWLFAATLIFIGQRSASASKYHIKVILGSKWLVFESVLTLVCVGIQFAPHNGRKKKVTTNQLNNGINFYKRKR